MKPRDGNDKPRTRVKLSSVTIKQCGPALLINFNAALIKDGISHIVHGLEEESHAKPQGRQEHQETTGFHVLLHLADLRARRVPSGRARGVESEPRP